MDYNSISSFEEFKDAYVEPTKVEYREFLFTSPTWKESQPYWHASKDPMSETEYQSYVESVGKENADSIARSRARTPMGHYIVAKLHWVKNLLTFSYEDYKAVHYENAYNAWSYSTNDLY